jgi:hypothetical protein
MIRPFAALLAVCVLGCGAIASAQTKKPRLPPGRDPGGVAIAVLSTGIDYTRAEIAARLARDGEGEIIGWNFVDNDSRPFASSLNPMPANWGGDGSVLAAQIGVAGVRLIPVRIDPGKPATLARAIAFVARTPARIVLVPMWSEQAETWAPFRQAVEQHPELLVVTAASGAKAGSDAAVTAFPASYGLDNLLVVAARTEAHDLNTFQKQSADVWYDVAPTPDGLRQPDGLPPAEVIAGFLQTVMNCSTPAKSSGAGAAVRKLHRLQALLSAPKRQATAKTPAAPCALLVGAR